MPETVTVYFEEKDVKPLKHSRDTEDASTSTPTSASTESKKPKTEASKDITVTFTEIPPYVKPEPPKPGVAVPAKESKEIFYCGICADGVLHDRKAKTIYFCDEHGKNVDGAGYGGSGEYCIVCGKDAKHDFEYCSHHGDFTPEQAKIKSWTLKPQWGCSLCDKWFNNMEQTAKLVDYKAKAMFTSNRWYLCSSCFARYKATYPTGLWNDDKWCELCKQQVYFDDEHGNTEPCSDPDTKVRMSQKDGRVLYCYRK
jgi:hypothetical protein